MAETGKRRMTLRSGRAVLGDLSNKGGAGGQGLGGLVKKAGAAAASSCSGVTKPSAAAGAASRQQQQQPHAAAAAGAAGGGAAAAAARARQQQQQEAAAAAAAAAAGIDEGLECLEEEEEVEEEEMVNLLSSSDEEGDADVGDEEEEEDEGARAPLQPVVSNKRKASSSEAGAAAGGKRSRREQQQQQEEEEEEEAAAPPAAAQLPLPPLQPLHPVDRKDQGDVTQALEYVEDIHAYLKEGEARCAARPYMQSQKEINAKMRAILIDWIVEVHMKFKLVPPTLYLAVQLIDRYCMDNPVTRTKLQLVGVTALLIACKYEEIYPPEVRDCVYITDNAYTREEVLRMEQKILQHFGFRVSMPTMHGFLVRYLKIAQGSHLCTPRAYYFAERALQEHEMLQWPPSQVAAAAVYLAKRNETLDAWTPALIQYSGYTESELLPCAVLLSKWAHETTQTQSRRLLNAVKKKFASSKFMEISEADHLRLQA